MTQYKRYSIVANPTLTLLERFYHFLTDEDRILGGTYLQRKLIRRGKTISLSTLSTTSRYNYTDTALDLLRIKYLILDPTDAIYIAIV